MNIERLTTNCAILPTPNRDPLVESGYLAIGAGRILASGPMAACPEATATTVLDGRG